MKQAKSFLRDLVTDPILFAIVATIVVMLVAGCGTPTSSSIAPTKNPTRSGKGSLGEAQTKIVLTEPTNLRYAVNDVVEVLVELPAGSEIALASDPVIENPNYRHSSGRVVRSEAGFFHPIEVLSVPKDDQARYPTEIIQGWNSIAGGLYISSGVSTTALPVETE